MSRVDFSDQSDLGQSSEHVYYDDGFFKVTTNHVFMGRKTLIIPSLQGVEWGSYDRFTLGNVMIALLGVIGITMGLSCIMNTMPVIGWTFLLGGIAMIWKTVGQNPGCFVIMKISGLNNEGLNIKKEEHAKAIADCILRAITDHHNPPSDGHVVYEPIFPSPVTLRN